MADLPWGLLGYKGEWRNATHCLVDCGMHFKAEMEDLTTLSGTTVEEVVATVRWLPSGQQEILGIVSPDYGIIQNWEAFNIATVLCNHGGLITHAGFLNTGLAFMAVKMENFDINGDAYEMYALITNSFNGKYAMGVVFTPIRLFCKNQFRKLFQKKGAPDMLKLRHTSNAAESLMQAEHVLEGMAQYTPQFMQMVQAQIETPASKENVNQMLDILFPKLPPQHPRAKEINAKREARKREWWQTYGLADTNRQYRGTVFGLTNAYFDYLSHGKTTKGDDKERQFSNVVSGRGVSNTLINYLSRLAEGKVNGTRLQAGV